MEHQWAFGDYDDDRHFLQIENEKFLQRIVLDAEDMLILRDMLGDAIETEGYEEIEVFG